jgi:hypothetical protein
VRVLPAFLLLCVLFGGGTRALAEADEYERSIALAVAEFEAGHWDEARALFRRAHELDPNARTWRGLAITAFELRRYVDSTRELEAALADTRKPLTEQMRAQLSALLLRARAFVSVYHLTVQPADSTLSLDGGPPAAPPRELLLDPGAHSLLLQAEGHSELRVELRAEAGQRKQLALTLVRAPRPDSPSPAASPGEPPAASEARPRFIAAWTLGAASLLGAGSAIGLGVAAKREQERFQQCTGSDENCDGRRTKGKRYQLGANLAISLAGACAIGAVLDYFLEMHAARRRQSSVSVALDLAPNRAAAALSLPF